MDVINNENLISVYEDKASMTYILSMYLCNISDCTNYNITSLDNKIVLISKICTTIFKSVTYYFSKINPDVNNYVCNMLVKTINPTNNIFRHFPEARGAPKS